MKKLLLLLFLIFLTACTSYPVGQGPDLIYPITTIGEVRTISTRVDYGNVASKNILNGVIRLHSEAVLHTGNAAIMGELFVWPGDTVTEGQLIARLSVSYLQERYNEQAQRIANMRRMNNITNEELLLEIDILEMTYASILWTAAEVMDADAIEGISQIRESIVWATLALDHARANQALDLQDEELILAELREALTQADIFAPTSGTVTALSSGPGWWVNTRSPILYIACNYNSHVFLEYVGQQVSIQDFRDAARLQGQIEANVFDLELISPTPAQNLYYRRRGLQSSIRFNILCDNPPPVGTSVAIHQYLRWYQNVLRIPHHALFWDNPSLMIGPFVYKIVDGQRIATPITIGEVTTTYIAVLSGLREGDEIYVRS